MFPVVASKMEGILWNCDLDIICLAVYHMLFVDSGVSHIDHTNSL